MATARARSVALGDLPVHPNLLVSQTGSGAREANQVLTRSARETTQPEHNPNTLDDYYERVTGPRLRCPACAKDVDLTR